MGTLTWTNFEESITINKLIALIKLRHFQKLNFHLLNLVRENKLLSIKSTKIKF